jgi:hypothetical protein
MSPVHLHCSAGPTVRFMRCSIDNPPGGPLRPDSPEPAGAFAGSSATPPSRGRNRVQQVPNAR